MPLTLPRLDDRTYNDILRETIARIPVHTPEWTNHNDSDPGITLLQLFAFMTENLLYRSNLIPERNRRKFLQLLDVPMQPAAPAGGVVTILNQRGPLDTVTLPSAVPVLAGRIGFITTRALDILPIEGRVYYRRRLTGQEEIDALNAHAQLFDSQTDDQTDLEFYQTVPFEAPASVAAITSIDLASAVTVDRALWVALLARPGDAPRDAAGAIAGRVLTLGLVPAVDDSARVLRPGGAPASDAPTPLEYHLSTRELSADQPVYQKLQSDESTVDDVTLVQLSLPDAATIDVWDDLLPGEDGVGDYPPVLDDDTVRSRLIAWVRVRVSLPQNATDLPAGVKVRYSWLGVNATRITQRIAVIGEPLGTGTGEPDQRVRLVNTPVIASSVALAVGGELWTQTDDLLAAPPEVPTQDPALPPGSSPPPPGNPSVFTVDSESGDIRFGDGLRGRRPASGASMFASYAYGGGRAGNVGIGAVKSSPLLPAGFQVSNPLPTWGGTEGETVAEAERSIPLVLKHANRAVSQDDIVDIVGRTPGIDLGRVDVLPLFHPDVGSPAPGVVTVLVVPNDNSRPEGPVPDQNFLRAICEYLEPRRTLTSEIHVRGPEYVGVSVSVGITAVAGREIATVREAVKAAVRQFLSPLLGGQTPIGWPRDQNVEDRELLVVAARVDGVARVNQVLLWGSSSDAVTTVPIAGLQLPRLDRLGVAIGDADDLLSTTDQAGGGGTTGKPKRRLAVPAVPKGC
jgi:hypothetical protein